MEMISLELSHSKVQAYQRCPYLYYLVFDEHWRSGPTARQAFGSTLHNVLARYLSKDNLERTEERLLSLYNELWINEGYETLEKTYDSYEEGKKILGEFFRIDRERQDDVVGTEADFDLPLDGISFRGTVDRIDRSSSGVYSVVEYKTSAEYWSPERIENDLQMTFYALGVEKGLGYKPLHLKYLFLSTGQTVTTSRTEQQISAAKELLFKIADQIRLQKFEPRHQHCPNCEFKLRCSNSVFQK